MFLNHFLTLKQIKMGKIKLEEYNDDYSTEVKHGLPNNDEEVFFKTKSGNQVKGFYYHGFDSSQENWDINDEAVSWCPVKIDE